LAKDERAEFSGRVSWEVPLSYALREAHKDKYCMQMIGGVRIYKKLLIFTKHTLIPRTNNRVEIYPEI